MRISGLEKPKKLNLRHYIFLGKILEDLGKCDLKSLWQSNEGNICSLPDMNAEKHHMVEYLKVTHPIVYLIFPKTGNIIIYSKWEDYLLDT